MARQRVEFGRDPGLTARMLLTLFLLGLLYVVLVGVLFASGASGVTIAVIAGALLVGQFFLSDKIGLAAMGAKQVTPEQAPGFHAMIERLCIQADLPKPKIAIADTPMPNAFAIGRVQQQDLRAAEGMSAFFIVSPGVKSAVRTLFMDHPPTEKRIERLQALEAQLQVAGPRAA